MIHHFILCQQTQIETTKIHENIKSSNNDKLKLVDIFKIH
jgi:hypothetical protein